MLVAPATNLGVDSWRHWCLTKTVWALKLMSTLPVLVVLRWSSLVDFHTEFAKLEPIFSSVLILLAAEEFVYSDVSTADSTHLTRRFTVIYGSLLIVITTVNCDRILMIFGVIKNWVDNSIKLWQMHITTSKKMIKEKHMTRAESRIIKCKQMYVLHYAFCSVIDHPDFQVRAYHTHQHNLTSVN